MQGLRGGGESAIEWIVAGYAISTAVAARHRRPASVTGSADGGLFSLGMAIFHLLTSAECALAPDPGVLVAARVVQGAGGAALMAPNILSILGVVYTVPARVRAISIYGMVMGLAATSGQLYRRDPDPRRRGRLGWRAIFWINVPLGLAALIAAARLVPRIARRAAGPPGPARRGPDHRLPGGRGAAAGRRPAGRLAGLVLGGTRRRCAARRRVRLLPAAQGRPRRGVPLLDPRIFAAWPLRAGLLTQTCSGAAGGRGYLVLGLYLQQGRGLSALSAGAVFTVLAVGYLATSFRAPALTMRFGTHGDRPQGPVTAAAGDAACGWPRRNAGVAGSVAWLFPRAAAARSGAGAVHHPR